MYQQYPVKPSGTTAIIASVLSLIGAVLIGAATTALALVKPTVVWMATPKPVRMPPPGYYPPQQQQYPPQQYPGQRPPGY